ncbi:hypothetical protein BH09PLA1_BH09PLA1_35490 [soil metagenome]
MSETDPPINPDMLSPAPVAPPVLDYGVSARGYVDPDAVVRLATYSDPIEAELVRAKLQSEGIRCSLEGAVLMGGVGGYGQAMRNLDIEVVQADAERARGILNEVAASRSHRRRDPKVPAVCPNCGSTARRRSRVRGALTVVALLAGIATMAVFPVWLIFLAIGAWLLCTLENAKWLCKSCGYCWRHDPSTHSDAEADDESDSPLQAKSASSRGESSTN